MQWVRCVGTDVDIYDGVGEESCWIIRLWLEEWLGRLTRGGELFLLPLLLAWALLRYSGSREVKVQCVRWPW